MSQTTPRPENHSASRHVYVRLETDEAATFLLNSTQMLVSQLDLGNFDGVVGANQSLVMKLELVSDLLYILAYSKNKENESSVGALFGSGQHLDAIENGVTNLLSWVFRNHREKEEKTNNSPALEAVNRISELINVILHHISEYESVIKVALAKLMNTVKQTNQEITSLGKSQQIGWDLTVKFSKRTNKLFKHYLHNWLVTDTVASYFVFDLEGFDFLLDNIGLDDSEGGAKKQEKEKMVADEEEKEPAAPINENIELMSQSDINSFLETNLESE